jgi:ABC-type transport system involved in multi-copper enzyme maturation permease subunit
MRWGPGPVFIYECLVNSRRWQTYALRAAGVAALLCAMATTASSRERAAQSWRDYAALGQGYFISLIGVELAIVLLAAPAATAGAICVDRARGTLAHMLMTDLSDPEIVLGKLAARLLPVLGLVACTWPVMAICSLLGGIDPIALTLAFAIIVTVAILGCSIAMAISVWARKSHEVILATYTVFILCILFWPIWYVLRWSGWIGPAPDWALLANPFYVAFAPYSVPGNLGVWDYFGFFAVSLGAALVFTLIAVTRMRPVANRGSTDQSTGPRFGWLGIVLRWLPGPSLDRNPVLWREWHRSRPTRWMTAIVILLMGTTFVLCVGGATYFWIKGVIMRPGAVWLIVVVCAYILHVIFGLLMLAALAPTSMAEERQRGSLDLLATTTLSTRAIVIGKWLGTFRLVWLMIIGPALLALAMATARSTPVAFGVGLPPDYYREVTLATRCYGVALLVATIVAHGALITSVGLALAVWIKRQSRVIAMSVGWFVLSSGVWPILVLILGNGAVRVSENLAALSPVVTSGNLVTLFAQRRSAFVRGVIWSGTFWALEVFLLAMGLLWLTVRTFDHCLDRMPERARSISLTKVPILILAAMIGAGSLPGAVAFWVEGVEPTSSWLSRAAIMAFSLFISIGLLLVGADAVRSGRPRVLDGPDADVKFAVRRFVAGRWCVSFCLVLLLAIGPSLLALSLATARRAARYDSQVTKNAQGLDTVTYVLVRTDLPYPDKVKLRERLILTGILLTTILAHGAAAVSVGLGLATFREWSRRAIATVVALVVLAALVQPFCLFVLNGFRPLDDPAGSLAMAMSSLLTALVSRTSLTFDEHIFTLATWNSAVALFAVGLLAWTIWLWQRRASRALKIKRLQTPGFRAAQPVVEAGLIRD